MVWEKGALPGGFLKNPLSQVKVTVGSGGDKLTASKSVTQASSVVEIEQFYVGCFESG